jgi:hexaprenyl-diphosphate synthase
MNGIPENQSSQDSDPFSQLSPQLSQVRLSVLSLIESGHPTLNKVTGYYFQLPSKQIRPLIVFLFSRATNGLGQDWEVKLREATCTDTGFGKERLDNPLSHPNVLNDWNPCMPEFTASFMLERSTRVYESHCLIVPVQQPTAATTITKPTLFSPTYILPTQMRLAEIVEMIHTASLLHDDVIDVSSLRRGLPSAPAMFGSKLTVLGGNFVLGRATAALARLGDTESTGLITCVISNLVEGEFLQLNDVEVGEGVETNAEQQRLRKDAWLVYLQKTYMKTGSLIAKSAKAAVILGGCQPEEDIWPEIAYAYGRNLGIAFQVHILFDIFTTYSHACSV